MDQDKELLFTPELFGSRGQVIEGSDDHGLYYYLALAQGTPLDQYGYWLQRPRAIQSLANLSEREDALLPDGKIDEFGNRIRD